MIKTVTASRQMRNRKDRYPIQCIKRHWQLYLIFSVPLFFVLLFSYGPMYGLIIAFKNYVVTDGVFGSEWVGLRNFKDFLYSHQFPRLIKNTLGISLYSLLAGFPIPIVFAVMLNECINERFKKTVQMVSYAPYFISTVVMVSMVLMFLGPRSGIVNSIVELLGGQRTDYMAHPEYFKSIYVWSGVWQGTGYNSVIYIAALSGIDQSLYEAAKIDGASKIQKIWHIDIPGIIPTIVILLILNFGSIMSVGYEKVLLMQNPANMSSSDVISTYVYRLGLEKAQYSFSTAVSMFNSVVNAILLVIVNQISRKVGETSLW